MKTWYKTRITELLGIDYPIIQGPFGGGLSSSRLVSTVSNLGGLGGYGVHHLSPEKIIEIDKEIKLSTTKPYALNLWVSTKDKNADKYSIEEFKNLCKIFKPYFDELSIPLPEGPRSSNNNFEDQVEAVLKSKPPVLSFVFGIPSPEILKACRTRGIKLIGTATTVDEALALETAGVDAIVVTGFEAGGHRVSFIRPAEESLTGTFVLIPQAADKIKIPIIAAGGIADGRGIVAALTLGADAVQIGTAFLACKESNATDAHRAKIFSEDAKYTVLTKLFTGRLARGIQNRLTKDLGAIENNIAPYSIQGNFLSTLREAAIEQKKYDMITFWAGQISPILKHKNVADLMTSLIVETGRIYNRRS
ncbi:MAG: nitronate monooxygenase [Bacteroidetes bacterium]|nr:nitronate monooxygenase [Bacteroidota bacterium]